MATKKAAKKPTKTGFVLGLPRDLPAAKVVQKAKAVGITLTAKQTYKIRSLAKARNVTETTKPAAKGKRKTGKLSASDFIRKHPTKSAAEIVELGKRQKGLKKFTISSVYTTRAYDKNKSGGSKKKPGSKSKTPKFQVFKGGGGAAEEQFKNLLAHIGIARATELMEEAASWGRVFGVVK